MTQIYQIYNLQRVKKNMTQIVKVTIQILNFNFNLRYKQKFMTQIYNLQKGTERYDPDCEGSGE